MTVYDLDRESMEEDLKFSEVNYRYYYPEGGYWQYPASFPYWGKSCPADKYTKMQDDDTKEWYPIPEGYTAPHYAEDYVDAVNHQRQQQHAEAIAYINSVADKTVPGVESSSTQDEMIIADLGWDLIQTMQKELHSKDAKYQFKLPNEEVIEYEGDVPKPGIQSAADRLLLVWDERKKKYMPIPDGFTAPVDPKYFVIAYNWEEKNKANEKLAQKSLEAYQQVQRASNHVSPTPHARSPVSQSDPPEFLESDLSGSDYTETRALLEKERQRKRDRGQVVDDTEEDDEEEDRKMQLEDKNERRRGASTSQEKGKGRVHCDPHAEANFILDSLNLQQTGYVPLLDDLKAPTKFSHLKNILYSKFGIIVEELVAWLGEDFNRSAGVVLQQAGLLTKEKRNSKRDNDFRTYVKLFMGHEMEGCKWFISLKAWSLIYPTVNVQEWNVKFKKLYDEFMEGATTPKEQDQRMEKIRAALADKVTNESPEVHRPTTRVKEVLNEVELFVSHWPFFSHSFLTAMN